MAVLPATTRLGSRAHVMRLCHLGPDPAMRHGAVGDEGLG
jgi:hypothetical protein